MPIFMAGGAPAYFAHVPRCGGTSIEDYLAERFGPLAMLDREMPRAPQPRWNQCSPQHIEADALERLFPPGFFARSFAVVRHPVERIMSVYRFNRDVFQTIDPLISFEDWLSVLPQTWETQPRYLDNHPRPMTVFVPAEATLFRLEDGFAPLIGWLDGLAGGTPCEAVVARRNSYEEGVALDAIRRGPAVEMTPRAARLILDLYGADFERFGYDPAVAV